MRLAQVPLPSLAIAPQTSTTTLNGTAPQTAAISKVPGLSMLVSDKSERVLASLVKLVEPVGLLLKYRYRMQLSGLDLALYGGRVIMRTWSRSGSEVYTTMDQSEGQHMAFVLAIPNITSRRLKMSIVSYRMPSDDPVLNFRWTIRFHKILAHDHPCLAAIERDDLGYLQHELSRKRLQLSHCTAGGYSLLHVSISHMNYDGIRLMLV
jgi:hypothetical protein